MEVFLIRHTSVQISKSVCYGQSDIELAGTFTDEWKPVLQKLTGSSDRVVYCSPLQRCIQLAEIISPVYTTDKRLMEVNFGDWEGTEWAQIPDNQLTPWMKDFVVASPPNGESLKQLYQRVCEFLVDLLAQGHSQVVIVTHAGVIRSFVCHCLGIPLANAFRLQIDYGSVSRILFQNQLPSVAYINR